MANLLWTIIVILAVVWLLGFALHIGGPLIHIVIVAAILLMAYNFFTKGKAAI
jgi:hypothetical protein